MDDLAKMLEGHGYSFVQTYVQSGNAVFEAKGTQNEKLEREIEAAIKKNFWI